MRILYLANIRLPTEKAHGFQIMKMCEAFARLGHQVELVIPSRRTAIAEDPFSYYGLKPSFSIVRLPVPDTVSWGKLGFYLHQFLSSAAMALYALAHASALIYSRDESTLFLLLPFHRKKLAWEMHTKRQNIFSRRLIARGVRIVPITEGLKEELLSWGADARRILVAPDAVDVEEFELAESPEQVRRSLGLPGGFIAGYVGKMKTMGESKGVDELIEAAGRALWEGSDLRLMLVGVEKEEEAEVRAEAREAGIPESNLLCVGHVPHRDVPRYLCAADALVMNYPGTEHYARFMSPLKLFEYLAAGRPIVSSDLPSVREILDERSALFVPPGDTGALAAALQRLEQDRPLRQALCARSLALAKEHTWSARAQRIISFCGL